MGMYDTIMVRCIYCRKKTNSQTKILGKNAMHIYRIGDEIYDKEFATCIFQLKTPCNCGKYVRIILKNKTIMGLTKEQPSFIEENFGSYIDNRDEIKKILDKLNEN